MSAMRFHLCFLPMMLSCWLPSSRDLKHVVGRLAAECEVAKMRPAPSYPRPRFLSATRWLVASRSEESPVQEVLFKSEARMEQDRLSAVAAAEGAASLW